ncbi:SLC13 family permease [Bacillus cereus]|uniref:SLC13 family permease n=1 Tax=Bacillus cereus TaxID=1396 RepID=UPI000BFD8E8E|nr:SLC13 family permease [Bacillus cereus]PGZ06971.1 SLC13 family permease [Bacillus cereus]
MIIHGIITLLIIFITFIVLMCEKFPADIVMFSGLVSLMMFGVLAPSEALEGFSNEGTLTIGALLIIASAVNSNNFIKQIPRFIIGHEKSHKKAILKLMMPVASLSAFINNTPIIVILTPIIKNWAQKIGLAPSKLLIPLAYAASMGGMCTLLGTSTNIVVNSLLKKQGNHGLSMFELGIIGIPCTVIGILFMVFIGSKLLPEYKKGSKVDEENKSAFLAEVQVESGCPLIGKTIKQANLRNLAGLYLIGVMRDEDIILPISSDYILNKNDCLLFTGDISTIFNLEKIEGFTLHLSSRISLQNSSNNDITLSEIVISKQSCLSNRTVKEIQFRSKYNAVVIAVFRSGKRILSKIGSIRLKTGDILYILSENKFFIESQYSNDFYFLSHETGSPKNPSRKQKMTSFIPLLIFFLMILCAGIGVLPILTASFLSVILLFITKSISVQEARKYLDLRLLIMIGSSLGMASALEKTGVADYLANTLVGETATFSPTALLAIIYLLTWISTEFLSNTAAAAFIFPIAFSIAKQLSLNPEPFIIAIAIAASASFATPTGYQANLIVYQAGGYKFVDFLKIGLPLGFLFMIISVLLIPYFWPFYT